MIFRAKVLTESRLKNAQFHQLHRWVHVFRRNVGKWPLTGIRTLEMLNDFGNECCIWASVLLAEITQLVSHVYIVRDLLHSITIVRHLWAAFLVELELTQLTSVTLKSDASTTYFNYTSIFLIHQSQLSMTVRNALRITASISISEIERSFRSFGNSPFLRLQIKFSKGLL